MITGRIDHSDRIEGLDSKLKSFFDFVCQTDFDKLPMGKNEIDGENIYVMNLLIDGADKSKQPLEMHRKYIDVHVLLDGIEEIGWKPIEEIANYTQEYREDGDCALSDDTPHYYIKMHPGEFCIVYPEDTHAPAISDGKIRKLIGKIKL